MSGHSKWSQIKHQKGVADKRRGQLFSKLSSQIAVAAREGADPATNFKLRLAIETAKAANLPKENIERAITRGSGKEGEKALEEEIYEAYGPEGIGLLIEVATDNKNRALSEIKAVLNRRGGKLTAPGSVQYLFQRQGEFKVISAQTQEEELKIIDSGATDYQPIEEGYLVYAEPSQVDEVKRKLEEDGLKIEGISLVYEPKEVVSVPSEKSKQALELLEELENLPDVLGVHTNLG